MRRAVKALVKAAQPRVVRRVAHQHHVGKLNHRRFLQGGGAETADQRVAIGVVLAETAVSQQQVTVVVAGEETASERRLPDRSRSAQLVKHRVRIGQKSRVAHIKPERSRL
jgi:hypothetical protein